MDDYKQVILVRHDLKLPKGKLAAQVAHASVDAVLKKLSLVGGQSLVKAWRREGMRKIVLKVLDERDLFKFIQQAKDAGLVTSVITDAGKTVVAPGTVTCGAIGPDETVSIDKITNNVPLL